MVTIAITPNDFQRTAQDIVDAELVNDAAQECSVSTGTIRSWANGTMCPPSPDVRKAYKEAMQRILRGERTPGLHD